MHDQSSVGSIEDRRRGIKEEPKMVDETSLMPDELRNETEYLIVAMRGEVQGKVGPTGNRLRILREDKIIGNDEHLCRPRDWTGTTGEEEPGGMTVQRKIGPKSSRLDSAVWRSD